MKIFLLWTYLVSVAGAVGGAEIHDAVTEGDVAAVQALLTSDPASVNAKDSRGWTPLRIAAGNGNQKLVTFLLENHADVNLGDEDGKTALHLASARGNKPIVECLLAHQADVNALDHHGETPLHGAAGNGRTEVVVVLLAHHADVNADRADGKTPLEWAAASGHKEVVDLLRKAGASSNLKIHEAVIRGDARRLEMLLARQPVLVNAKGDFDRTPLHLAAQYGDLACVKILLNHGAELESQTSGGLTALEWAATLGNVDVADYLLFKTAKTNLYVTGALGKQQVLKDYWETETSLKPGDQLKCANIQEGNYARTGKAEDYVEVISLAFTVACRNGHVETAKFLLTHGARIDFRGSYGATGLHWAARRGYAEMVAWLLSQGANPALADEKYKKTPIEWAMEKNQTEVVNLLRQQGMKK